MPGPVAAAAIAGGASLLGGVLGNRAARKEAARNRAFQERMRNTQWQAGVADMRAAGINPALAYQQGPAAAPSGSMASQEDVVSRGVSSAMQARRLHKELAVMDATERKVDAEARTADAAARLAQDRAGYLLSRGSVVVNGRVIRGVPPYQQLLDAEISQALAGATNTQALAARNRALTNIATPMADLSERFGEFLPLMLMLMAPGGPASGAVRRGLGGATAGGAALQLPKGARYTYQKYVAPALARRRKYDR